MPKKTFKEKVLEIVKKIEKANFLTYKEVARLAGNEKAWRVVGNILSKNKDPKIPCHRVIRSNGTVGGYQGSFKNQFKKLALLLKEGVALKRKAEKLIIISLGGSLVCPKDLDIFFLKKFKRFISKQIKKGRKFLIVVGGGNLARKYQAVGRIFKISSERLDKIGIGATLLHATLFNGIFEKLKGKVIFVGGEKPGQSTDLVAVKLARKLRSKLVLNLTNIDFVYERDPRRFKGAKPLRKTSFDQFLKIVGEKWLPGANFPFDPIATKMAKKFKIKIVILNGRNFKNLENFFRRKKFFRN